MRRVACLAFFCAFVLALCESSVVQFPAGIRGMEIHMHNYCSPVECCPIPLLCCKRDGIYNCCNLAQSQFSMSHTVPCPE